MRILIFSRKGKSFLSSFPFNLVQLVAFLYHFDSAQGAIHRCRAAGVTDENPVAQVPARSGVERVLFRPFVGNMELTMIVSFGVMLILQASSLVSFGVRDKSFGSPFNGSINLGTIGLSEERMAVVICAVVFMALLYIFIQRTKLGKAMRAVSQDMEAASVQGININICFSLAMGMACALAALGGALMGPIFYVNPYMGVEPIMKAFVAVILGGMGSLPGAVIGGFIVGMGESFVTTYVGAHLAMMVVFLVMIGVFLFKPAGILGHEE